MSKINGISSAALIAVGAFGALLIGSGSVSAQPVFADPGQGALTVHRRFRVERAYPRRLPLVALPVAIPLDDSGVVFQTPFSDVFAPDGYVDTVRVPHYQGPDGTYDNLADLTNSIQGTPCGRECTARSLVRWGYLPAE